MISIRLGQGGFQIREKNMLEIDPIIEYYFADKSIKLLLEAITELFDVYNWHHSKARHVF